MACSPCRFSQLNYPYWGYVYMTAGLNSTPVETSPGFPTTRTFSFWKKILQSTWRARFSTRVELLTCIFQLLSTRVEISIRPSASRQEADPRGAQWARTLPSKVSTLFFCCVACSARLTFDLGGGALRALPSATSWIRRASASAVDPGWDSTRVEMYYARLLLCACQVALMSDWPGLQQSLSVFSFKCRKIWSHFLTHARFSGSRPSGTAMDTTVCAWYVGRRLFSFWLNVSLLLTASSVNKERNQTSISWYIY